MVVEAVHRLPRLAAVARLEEALGTRARVPHARFVVVSGSQPERVVDRALVQRGRGLVERGRLGGFLPRLALVGTAEDGRTQVPRASRTQQRALLARIRNEVMHDVTQEPTVLDLPGLALGIGLQAEGTLAGSDEDLHAPLLGARDSQLVFGFSGRHGS